MSQHSQNFKLTTRRNSFDCRKRDENVGEEVWEVDMASLSRGVTAKFILPKTWARTMVFQYLNSLEQGDL
jgi:hypothetical protein